MSGSSHSDGGGYSWSATPSNNCDIELATVLNSPNEDLLVTIRMGDILDVQIVVQSDRKLVAVVNRESQVVGIITAMQAATLLKCIEEGNEYISEVTKLQIPACHVKINRKIP